MPSERLRVEAHAAVGADERHVVELRLVVRAAVERIDAAHVLEPDLPSRWRTGSVAGPTLPSILRTPSGKSVA